MSHAPRGNRYLHKVEVLRAMAEHLNREVELQPMLDSALALILQLLDLKTGWIVLLDDDGRFTLVSAHGLPPALEADERSALRYGPCRCQRMLLSGELSAAANIVDCERLQRIRQTLAGEDVKTVHEQTADLHVHVSVPLRAGNRTLGLLNLARVGKESVDSETLALLQLAGDTLGIAIERARLYAQVESSRRQEAEAVTRLTQTLLGITKLEEIAKAVFAALRQSLHPDALSLLVVDPSGTFLELVAGWGWSEGHVGRLQLSLHPPDANGPAWALHLRRPVVEDHTKPSVPFSVPEPVRQAGVQVCLNLPMVARDTKTGVIVVDYLTPQQVSEEQLRFAGLVTGVAAVAVERALDHRRNRTLFEKVPVGLYRSTPDGRLLDVNEAMVRMLGYPDRSALLALNAVEVYANVEDRARWKQLMDREGVVSGFEVQWRRFDGTIMWVRESARAVRDALGRPAYYEGAVEDISARKRAEADLRYLANHDPLTGLFNRHRFQEELHRLIAHTRRTGQSGAVLFIDLDNFKEVNDRLGHSAGDDVLRAVARTMRAQLRETDLLARLGGDEFGVATAPADAEQAMAIAKRLLNAVREQVVLIAGRPLRLRASCGIALFPQHGDTADGVLVAADLSMYAAKDQGGGQAALYVADPAWRDRFGTALGWTERLQNAVAENRLVAYAQPILDLRKNEVTQWEFLARLLEEQEVLSPAVFIPIAERLNLVQGIDVWMCKQALQFSACRKRRVHVNLSPKTLVDDGAIQAIVSELDARREAEASLVMEITETAAIPDMTQALRRVAILRSRGCQVALDDFGVGFSSLYYMRHLPVDYLKIDASFIRRLVTDSQDRHVVQAITELARGLGRETIAEGVEDEATLRAVRALGVDYAQGYHIGRPVPVSQL